jgi:murein DD-endopeptidase MepM/ murein hydrolase activator NlpD
MILQPIDSPRVTSPYGERTSPFDRTKKEWHPGIDFGCVAGTKVFAPLSGRVHYAGHRDPQGFGIQLIIYHGKLPDGTPIYTQYAHLSATKVNTGDIVRMGQVVALTGNTGRSSGAHLHFEIRKSEFSDSGWIKRGAKHGQYHLNPAADHDFTTLKL